ncbi:MAG: dipicolinate synthase subunit DpsA [Eubacteriales bacterium]
MEMQDRHKIAIIGGDRRLILAAVKLAESGCECAIFGDSPDEMLDPRLTRAASLKSAVGGAFAVLAPIPLTRDKVHVNAPVKIDLRELIDVLTPGQIFLAGCISTGRTLAILKSRKVRVIDYNRTEDYALPNARATAEATVSLAVLNQEKMLSDCHLAIFGCGRITKFLIPLLLGMGAKVTVFARSPKERELAKTAGCTVSDFVTPQSPFADILINTVPAVVPCSPESVLLNGGLLIELAGVLRPETSRFRLLSAPSLPGRYSPKSMGDCLARLILSEIENSKPNEC